MRVGLVTPVMSLVGSVTSTCLRSNCGDMRIRSGPMPPLSSGAAPGQTLTAKGSAARIVSFAANEANNTGSDAIDFMMQVFARVGSLTAFENYGLTAWNVRLILS